MKQSKTARRGGEKFLPTCVHCHVSRSTLYMEAALNQVRAEGFEVKDEDVARLSPLIYKHSNFQGRYSFALSESVAQGGLRPLRDPYDQDA